MGRKPVEGVEDRRGKDRLSEAGARFDAVMTAFGKAWAEFHPSEPFVVDGAVTPRAMQFVEGYVAGRRAAREDWEGPEGESVL